MLNILQLILVGSAFVIELMFANVNKQQIICRKLNIVSESEPDNVFFFLNFQSLIAKLFNFLYGNLFEEFQMLNHNIFGPKMCWLRMDGGV